jgi:chromosomal replication initiator protein
LPEHLAITPAWQEIKSRLRLSVGASLYEIWIAPLELSSWDGAVLTVKGDPTTDAWVADRYGNAIEGCARTVLGQTVRVAFAGDPAAAAHASLSGSSSRARPAPSYMPAAVERINPRHTFNQFVIGESNRLAHAAALAVAEAPGQAYNPLFLHAPPGLGKTHLLHAIANYLAAFEPHATVRYTTVEAFTNGFIAALNGKALDRFKSLYRDVDVLLIDDVQFLASKAKTEEEFFHTFNALHDSGRQLVLTCDRLPSQLTGIERRLRDRFESGLVAHLNPPDLRTRIQILRKRTALDDIRIDQDDVLELIAERVTDNIRSLEGALIRVVAHHSLTGRPIDRELTSTVLDAIRPRPDRPAPGTRQVSIDQIQRFTANQFGISQDDLLGASRVASIAWARQLAIYLARELTDEPLQSIGQAFGGRNHATVLHACKRVSDRIVVNNDDAADLRDLSEAITSSQS